MRDFDVENFGLLKVEFVVIEDKYPRVFVVKKEGTNEKFLMYECNVTDKKYVWGCFGISNNELILLNDGKIKLENLLKERKSMYINVLKGKEKPFISRITEKENFLFLNKKVNYGFLDKIERDENLKKRDTLDYESVQLIKKKEKENVDYESFDVEDKKVDKETKIEGNYEDFEDFDRVPTIKIEKEENKAESKDEYEEDLENYEEFEPSPVEVEEGETQKNYFDDWDFKNPEKIEAELAKKEEKRQRKETRKKERQEKYDAFCLKMQKVLKSRAFWTKIIIVLLAAVLFITVFTAIFASGNLNSGGGGGEIEVVPDTTEIVEQ